MGNLQVNQLKKDELDALQKDTHFDGKELKNMYKQFRKETPAGVIAKEDFFQVLTAMGISDTFLQDLLFKAFANSKTGSIRFEDLVHTLSIITRGTTDEKLKFAFQLFDIECSGAITKRDLLKVLESFFKLTGPQITISGKTFETPSELADHFFDVFDADNTGKITLAQYAEGAKKHKDIISSLSLWER
mmetsp:Transcript_20724/g.30818  ORF Transcript_20724/g.30818 Transcript_20724/m.30818 type:complete len:189 (+) Transcript_20724:40-606(+)